MLVWIDPKQVHLLCVHFEAGWGGAASTVHAHMRLTATAGRHKPINFYLPYNLWGHSTMQPAALHHPLCDFIENEYILFYSKIGTVPYIGK